MEKGIMSKAKLILITAVLSIGFFPQSPAGRQVGDGTPSILAATQEILREVSKLRGLAVIEPVKADLQSRAEIERSLIHDMDKKVTPEEFDAQTKGLIMLGLVPRDFKLREFLIRLLTEQIAGYYRPETKMLYLADWLPLEEQRTVMVHELMHALQDQHFNLQRFEEPPEGRSDQDLAIHALIEGEATAVMLNDILDPQKLDITQLPLPLVQVLEHMQSVDDERSQILHSAPSAIRQTLLFPYIYGTGFIQYILKKASWDRISEAYKQPPDSTEQIMHPERFLTRDQPVEIRLERLEPILGEGWKRRLFDVNGEFGYFLLLSEFIDKEEARRAADGWDGDQMVLYEQAKAGRVFLVHRSTWDSEADATEFARAYSERIANRYAALRKLSKKGTAVRLWETSEGLVYMERRARDVLLLEGLPRSHRRRLRALVNTAWKNGND
jgi:hypothetical protein